MELTITLNHIEKKVQFFYHHIALEIVANRDNIEEEEEVAKVTIEKSLSPLNLNQVTEHFLVE